MGESFGIIGGAEDAFAGAMGGAFFGIFLVIYFLIILLSLAFSVASYVLSSLGLYTVADRRGIRNAWLAWLPIGNVWIVGSIADQYQYVAKGKITGRRKALLGLNIAVVVFYVGWLIWTFVTMFAGAEVLGALGFFFGALVFFALAITMAVFQYIAYYDLFRSCQPSNAVLYLVLSILIPVTMPFFVFFIRKKDLGMPPKKQPQAAPVAEETIAEAPAEEITEETVEEIAEESEEETAPKPAEETAEE